MQPDRIAVFEEMTTAQPDNEMIWYGLATEYLKVARFAEAVTALDKVVTLKPDYTAAYQLLGTAHSELGEHAQARAMWQKGLEIAKQTGAWKAGQHLERLLAESATSAPNEGFCQSDNTTGTS